MRVLVIVIISIITLLLMGIATTKVLVVISSQLLVVVFIFGNACKTVFEALIFVFIMHPFDVGDRCVIDGIQVSSRLPLFSVPFSLIF
jgi:small-conductance mechanosensitive channel